ncbi:MAG: hypothetical protein ACLTSX_00385 [Collinsella sp.]
MVAHSGQIARVPQQLLSVLMGVLDQVDVGVEVDEAQRDAAVLAAGRGSRPHA